MENFLSKKNALIFRLGTAYGASDNHSRVRLDLAVNSLSFRAISQKKLTYFGGTQWRPFIHVKDIAVAFINGLNSDAKGIYNITTENLQIKDLAKKVSKLTKCKA